uniref:Pyridoxamine 5'-phosphate oxidase N-terminal domain-containing protein n=1 Tax=Thermosporothrix sp. COM3 TaxID=2490863 RepID=A0A455SGY6_9CHLR|nr:hypothetical protein KTC_01460 [Thermosporothrix sp. COM3]
MTAQFSERAQAYLQEPHIAVLSTLNKDGSSQLTPVWYLLEDDGTIILNTQKHLRKAKNMFRDARVALCIQDGMRYVTINGIVEISQDRARVQDELARLIARYIDKEETRQQYREIFGRQDRISLHFQPINVIESL